MRKLAEFAPASSKRCFVLRVVVHSVFSSEMKTCTLTIRLSQSQREALRQCAKALKKTESEYIRDLLDSRNLSDQIGSLAGSVDSSQTSGRPHPLKGIVRRRNWRE
jgi:hypothetical protein